MAPSPEVADAGADAPPVVEASAGAAPSGPDEPLSTLSGLISRSLESANQLAAATRRRKAGSTAATEPDTAEPSQE